MFCKQRRFIPRNNLLARYLRIFIFLESLCRYIYYRIYSIVFSIFEVLIGIKNCFLWQQSRKQK